MSGCCQQPHRLGEPPLAGESVFGCPIFRGGCSDMFEGEDLEPCSVSSVDSEHSGEQEERYFGRRVVAGIQCGEGDSRNTKNSNTQGRVRFDLGETTIAPTAASNHKEAVGNGGAVCTVPLFVQEEEAGETDEVEGGEEEGGTYVATNTKGQRFVVRQRNGMHTAWRLQERNCGRGNPATTATVKNGITDGASPMNARWDQAMSADQLVSLTTPTPPYQQNPVRLFLRRTRPSPSTSSATNTVGTTAAAGALQVRSGARQIDVDSVDLRAFPPPWAGRRSPMGSKESRAQLSRGGRTRTEKGGEGPSNVLTPPRQGGGWATPSPAASPHQQHRRHGTSTSTPGHHHHPPLRRLASSRSSPRNALCDRGHDDENSPPPAVTTCISSPAVRRNLARAARKSKVGTKADPVTLYRQRQELEQTMIKNAAARNRQKASREARTSDGFTWGSGRAANTGTVVGGRRTRTTGSVVSRVGIGLR